VVEEGPRRACGKHAVVVYAHIPLWAVYPKWGWGTQDSEQALSLLKRFGSVTVLNGHIHQVDAESRRQRHVPHGDVDGFPATGAGQRSSRGSHEGTGRAAAPGARDQANVNYKAGPHHLAVVDSPLEGS